MTTNLANTRPGIPRRGLKRTTALVSNSPAAFDTLPAPGRGVANNSPSVPAGGLK